MVNGVAASDGEYDLPADGRFQWQLTPACAELRVRTIRFTDLSKPSVADILTSPDWEWTKPENLGAKVNSDGDESDPTLTADSLCLMFRSYRDGKFGLYECRRKTPLEPWGEAVSWSVAGASLSTPFLTADGLTLLSSYANGMGTEATDIWLVQRETRDAAWGQPKNLGPNVNSPKRENYPALSPDRLTLYFTSDRDRDGDTDVWVCRRPTPDAEFGKAEKLGAPVNSDAVELAPRPLADGSGFTFWRKLRMPQNSIEWLLATPKVGSEWDVRSLGVFRDPAYGPPTFANDGRSVLFHAVLPGGQGKNDLWQMRRVPKAKGTTP